MELLSEELSNYLENSCEPENDLLKHINRETHLKVSMPRMLSGHYQGRLLSMISKMIAPQRILEIGTFTGYATLCLAEGLQKNGLIYTIDINEELEDMVRVNFKKSDFDPQIKYQIGDAKQIIPTLNETFDLVFIDADKKNNATYYEMIMDSVRSGGLILIDNVLWSGKVLDQEKTDQKTTFINNFNEKVSSDSRVEKLILPVRDGLFIVRKK
ncbi:O-methyltransferase [Daejeonella sp.]|jgi:caffeoyl-CoA O-methyltransferase|uniref:O-methyltransferase n=1 Tax=Daejeonella sp. TaxID=2805397 RepID=UPI0037C18B99